MSGGRRKGLFVVSQHLGLIGEVATLASVCRRVSHLDVDVLQCLGLTSELSLMLPSNVPVADGPAATFYRSFIGAPQRQLDTTR